MTASNTDTAGRAYGMPAGHPDESIARCGPGTLGGELLRRYWQPVALSSEATELPTQIRVLDEELILYRDKSGTPGLLYPRCAHRGTSLLYGKVEETGIRCCYHGWLFDESGKCLEMPCEPQNEIRHQIRQPWYPVVEKLGLVFAYMGPPDKQPVFPKFSIEDELGDDQWIIPYKREAGPNGGGAMPPYPKLDGWQDYNWWQMFDNFMDAFHVVVLHNQINGTQFEPGLGILPEVEFKYVDNGVISIQHRDLGDGRLHQRLSQVMLPNMNGTAGVTDDDLSPSGLNWTVAIDDSSYVTFGLSRRGGESNGDSEMSIGLLSDEWGPQHGRPFREWSTEDHQRWQTDYIAQKAQGDISLHSEEHLTGIDAGIGMMRRLFRKQAQIVADGGDPIGVTYDDPYYVNIRAGNAIIDATSKQCIAGIDKRP